MENKYTQSYDHSKVSNRLMFIDVMRAYAILMMVQGHMIDTMLDPIYRDPSNWLFSLWDHMRGVTAPVFFFSSGTIFSYLLLRKNLPLMENERFFKGAKRVATLFLIGYLLRFNPGVIFTSGETEIMRYNSSVAVDALHCIAFGMGLILFSYFIHKVTRVYIWLLYLMFAVMAFYFFPNTVSYPWIDILPLPAANYLTQEYGSNFPVIPWTGFVMWGALLGFMLSKKANIAFNNIFAVVMLLLGLFLHYYSGTVLDMLFNLTGDPNLDYLDRHNFLFFHLGNVFIVLGVLAFISNVVKIPKILSSIGKNTMMIYVIHIFIIYGTGYNLGMKYFYEKSFTPWQAVIAAVSILTLFILWVYYWEKMKPYLQDRYPKLFPKKKII